MFNYSDTWQLVINTSTSIVTFLMVFLIQNTQNRDGAAIQAKLDELIRASGSQNTFIGIEHLTQEKSKNFGKCAPNARPPKLGETARLSGRTTGRDKRPTQPPREPLRHTRSRCRENRPP